MQKLIVHSLEVPTEIVAEITWTQEEGLRIQPHDADASKIQALEAAIEQIQGQSPLSLITEEKEEDGALAMKSLEVTKDDPLFLCALGDALNSDFDYDCEWIVDAPQLAEYE